MSASTSAAAPAADPPSTTIFVRNIPFTWQNSDLERAFEHIGPIKRGFVVTARGGGKKGAALGEDGSVSAAPAKAENRGFGFIDFATHSDAVRAAEEMNGKLLPEDSAADQTKKKGPQRLAVELSKKKGEKPDIAPKKDAASSNATAAAATPAPASTTTTTSLSAPKPKKEKLKDVKLDAATLAKVAPATKKPIIKPATSDSETSDDEDEDMAAKPKLPKAKAKPEVKTEAKTPSASTPAATRTSTLAPSASKATPLPAAAAVASTSRTVLLSGINSTVKDLGEHLKGLVSNLTSVLFPSPESTTKYKAARLTFETDALAEAAVKLLDKKAIKGDAVRAIRLSNEVKANRMIIRNLPWGVKEKRLHLIFRDCCKSVEEGGGGGRIVEIVLPKAPDGKDKGFGFISFTEMRAAELALKKTGTILNARPIAVDWALSKDDYETRVKLGEVDEKKAEEKKVALEEKEKADRKAKEKAERLANKVKSEGAGKGVKPEGDADGDAEMLDLHADKARNRAALAAILGDDEKDELEKEEAAERKEVIKRESKAAGIGKKVKDEDDMSDVEETAGSDEEEDESMSEGEDDEEDEDEEDDSDDDHDDDELNVSDESDDSMASSEEEEDEDDEEAAPELDQSATPKFAHPRTSDTVRGCTIFIRNLSYDTNEEKLLDKFRQFGGVKYGKVVWDKELDRSRGTAFVQFDDPAVAKKVVGMSVDTSTNPAALFKKNRITAAVASGTGITLDGRVLNIALAVDREQATTLAEKNKLKQAQDKRNLYLANEGNIRADSEAGQQMPKAELEKREKAFREKKKKLKNPNYCVSRTRLSVRNLPLEADEKLLGKVFMKAAREAVKQQPKESPLRDGTIGQPVLQQVKLLRATDRLDAAGVGKSKRYGFVEFSHHEHALLALRALNNNPGAFAQAEIKTGKTARPFVEFALEDARKLLIRQQKMAAMQKRKELKERQQKELALKEDQAAEKEKNKVKSSEQPRRKPIKPVKAEDAAAGGGKGACFTCGLGGHVAKNCPTAKGAEAPTTTGSAAAKASAPVTGAKRKATTPAAPAAAAESDEPAAKKSKASAPSAAAAPVERTKKNKNNKHRDIAVPSHLRDGDKEEAQFDQLVQQHKKKFFGADADKAKAATSRWFD